MREMVPLKKIFLMKSVNTCGTFDHGTCPCKMDTACTCVIFAEA
jgi:hypothetical protein